jgi:basic membrane protein A and related proteins
MSWKFLRLFAALAALSLVIAACATDEDAPPEEPVDEEPVDEEPVDEEPAAADIRVGLVYDIGGRGDLSFNDSAAAGLDQAIADFGVDSQELEPDEGGENREELLRLLSEQGFDLVFGVGFLFADSIAAAAGDFPDVSYGLIDGFVEDLDEDSNIVALGFAEHEGSFLVGAAAALKSENNHIGFIGGVTIDLIQKFEAGFVAGAREINPDIEIEISYISEPPDFSGFADPARGKEVALGQFDAGADVVYHAAGGSGAGLFEAAMEVSQRGDKVWAIGVDSDQYQTAPEELREYILTSMLKRVDVSVYETIADYIDAGQFTGGYRAFGLEDEGVGYSTSGGFIDDIVDQLEELKQRIIDGDITVPESP